MKRMLLLLYCLSFPVAIHAEVIDRIMAVVDGHIITASDVHQQREILMRLGDKPIDPSAMYTIVTIDYLVNVGGDRYGILREGKNTKALGITLRDTLLNPRLDLGQLLPQAGLAHERVGLRFGNANGSAFVIPG